MINGLQIVADAILVSRNCFMALEPAWLAVVPAATACLLGSKPLLTSCHRQSPIFWEILQTEARASINSAHTAIAE